MKYFVWVSCVTVVTISGILDAQEFNRLTIATGVGFSPALGTSAHNLNYGWNLDGGFGVNLTSYLGIMVDNNYSTIDVSRATLASHGYISGNWAAFSVTLDPIVHLTRKKPVDFYVTGGGGLYHVENPFFGMYPMPEAAVGVLSPTLNKPGLDIGGGIAFGSALRSKVYVEARFNSVFMGSYHTNYVPVTFGFRW